MVVMRIQLECDRVTARRVLALHREGRAHWESRRAAEAEARRLGRTPAGEPVFMGVSNGEPARLQYDVPVYPESTP